MRIAHVPTHHPPAALRPGIPTAFSRGFASRAHTTAIPQRLSRPSLSRPCKIFNPVTSASRQNGRRSMFTETLPTVLVPPAMFMTCFLGLWSYKIIMTIIFQNKFIYMPYMPPFARSEKIEDYAAACKPVQWQEKRIQSMDNTRISLCVGTIPSLPGYHAKIDRKHMVIIYFQGNGASLPPRLPALTGVLRALYETPGADFPVYSIVALSYRGFWTSKGKASQKGIELDAQATLAWVQENFPAARVVFWGQSLGAGVAADLVARRLVAASRRESSGSQGNIAGLVLETPFIGIKDMLLALYPQKWLPYRYLWPFLRSWWDTDAALRKIAAFRGDRNLPIQIITAARDEVVPASQGNHLHDLCKELQLDVRRRDVLGALHNEVPGKPEGRGSIVSFIREVTT